MNYLLNIATSRAKSALPFELESLTVRIAIVALTQSVKIIPYASDINKLPSTLSLAMALHDGHFVFASNDFMPTEQIWPWMHFSLTHFMSLVSFYTLWKHQKAFGFLMFSGVSKEISGMKWVNCTFQKTYFNCLFINCFHSCVQCAFKTLIVLKRKYFQTVSL